MTAAALKLPPLDENAAPVIADADTARRMRYLRLAIAEGRLSASLARLAQLELAAVEKSGIPREKGD